MTKLRIGILFGGKSAEHEVSVRSARNIFDALDADKYEPVLIGIDPSGRWHIADSKTLLDGPSDATNRRVSETEGEAAIMTPESQGELMSAAGDMHVDVVFPILHGPFGEDGTIQGLLKLADVPFVGPSVLGSAVGMDKDVMKRLLRDAGINVSDYVVLRHGEEAKIDRVEHLGFPLFVKPANLGSSIGISKVHDESEFDDAVKLAFEYDTKVLVEAAIIGREFECGILGNEKPQASVVGEVLPAHDFYSYDAKYLDESGASIRIPADLPEHVSEEIRSVALKTFHALECEGISRVDLFVTADNTVIVNEINTMPGFTSISMYPKLWEASGISYQDLISQLIDLAIERYERDKKLKTTLV